VADNKDTSENETGGGQSVSVENVHKISHVWSPNGPVIVLRQISTVHNKKLKSYFLDLIIPLLRIYPKEIICKRKTVHIFITA
jgi:hypothetical protein